MGLSVQRRVFVVSPTVHGGASRSEKRERPSSLLWASAAVGVDPIVPSFSPIWVAEDALISDRGEEGLSQGQPLVADRNGHTERPVNLDLPCIVLVVSSRYTGLRCRILRRYRYRYNRHLPARTRPLFQKNESEEDGMRRGA